MGGRGGGGSWVPARLRGDIKGKKDGKGRHAESGRERVKPMGASKREKKKRGKKKDKVLKKKGELKQSTRRRWKSRTETVMDQRQEFKTVAKD